MKIFRFGRSDYAWRLNFVRVGRTTREALRPPSNHPPLKQLKLHLAQKFAQTKRCLAAPEGRINFSVYSQWSYRTKEEWYSITRFKVRFLKWNRVTTRRWNLWRLISDRPSAFCGSLSIGTCGAQLHPHVSYGLRVTCLVSCLGLNETQFIV